MRFLIRALCVLLALLMVTPAYAVDEGKELRRKELLKKAAEEAESGVSDELDDEIEDDSPYRERKDWYVSVATATSIGQGTFAAIEDSDVETPVGDPSNAYDRWNMSWGVEGGVTLFDDYTAYVSIAGVQWFTDGGGINDSGEHRFQDIGAYVVWSGYTIPEADLTFGADLGLIFPTSDLSRFSNLIVSTGLGGSVAWRGIDGLTLSYSLSGGKDFHSLTSPSLDLEDVGAENVIFRAGGSESVGQGEVAIDGINTEWSLSNSFAASLSLWDFSLSISYILTGFWSYDVAPDDELTGEIAQSGRSYGQLQRGNVTLGYGFTEFANSIGLSSLSVNAGLRTATAPLTDDQQSVSFPFWNFDGAAQNASSIRFGLSASY